MRLWNAVDPEHPTKARECGVEVLLELPGESTEGLGDIPDTQALLDVHDRRCAVAGGVERRGDGAKGVPRERGALQP